MTTTWQAIGAMARVVAFLGVLAMQPAGAQTGLVDPNAGPAPEGAFPRAIRLVQ